jgi:hypothetical protein
MGRNLIGDHLVADLLARFHVVGHVVGLRGLCIVVVDLLQSGR